MIAAAEDAGLNGLGLTDHCIVSDDAFGRREQYDLVETYERLRKVIDATREETSLTLYDAAEMSYIAGEAHRIQELLEPADFDYVIGSVHFAGEYNYTSEAGYVGEGDAFRRVAVERYYEAVASFVESERFDVLSHLDLPERLETLRGYSQPSDYKE